MASQNSRLKIAPKTPSVESVEPGMAIPSLVKKPTTLSLFLFSSAVGISHRIHYDQAYARSEGHKDVLVHGPLQAAYLMQMLTDWLGDNGTLVKLSYRHHASAYPGTQLTCSGTIKEKREENGNGYLEIDLAVKNEGGEVVTSGAATVSIPGKPAN